MNRNYGLPYMGSKSKIADWIISNLPPADNFVEPFAGGCAVTHAALLSGKYKRIIFNDITDSTQVFIDAIKGKFKNENSWVSRNDFMRLKDVDPYVRLCFSFGNDQKTYAYSKEVEPYKRALHYAVMFKDAKPFQQLGIKIPQYILDNEDPFKRRMAIKKYMIWLKGNRHAGDIENLERLERLNGLESIGRSQNLESLGKINNIENLCRIQHLDRLENYQRDYKDVPIPKDGTTVIYCDPPYRGTSGYLSSFDFNEFDEWCRGHKENLFISEYQMPEDFKMISAIKKRSLKASNGSGDLKTEGLWVHESVYHKLKTDLFNPLYSNDL